MASLLRQIKASNVNYQKRTQNKLKKKKNPKKWNGKKSMNMATT